MRILIAALCLSLSASAVRADDAPAPKFYLVDGKVTTETRVAELEKRVAKLEAELAKKTAAVGLGCVCGDGCACPAGACPAKCPVVRARHISPDGTVNELHADGVYRPVPGAPKATPPEALPSYALPYLPQYSLPAGGCANGRCGIR